MTPPAIRLRPLLDSDEVAVRRAHSVIEAEGFDFAFDLAPGMPWSDYLRTRAAEHDGRELGPGRVPGGFLLATLNGEICGRASIRFALNDFLLAVAGHIGYVVLPEFRRRGIATEILRQSVVIARAHGVDRALLTCAETNIGSAAVIERCGGVRDAAWPTALADDGPRRRYWID